MQKTEDNKNSLTQNKENDRLDLYVPYHTTKKPLKINNFKGFRERETGIEPATPSLARRCSTAEPLAHMKYRKIPALQEGMKLIVMKFSCIKNFKRVMGIEPTYPAWKAGVLPLNYTRTFKVPRTGIEPVTRGFSVLCSTN